MKFTPFLIALLLIGCGASAPEVDDQTSTDPTPSNETEVTAEPSDAGEATDAGQNDDSPLQEPGDTADTEIGKMTLVKIIKPNESAQAGPVNLEIRTISIVEIEPLDSVKSMFEDKDRITTIGIAMVAENTSDDTISFHPNQGTIVTNTKEQKQASIFISDEIGGDFIGQVKKEGKILFLLDSEPDEISSITYVIEPPFSTEDFQQVGNKSTFEFTFD